MTNYVLAPLQNTVRIDNQFAQGVNFTGIDPTIQIIGWNGTTGNVNYTTGAFETITSFTPYQVYVDEAVLIIDAQNNPVTYYSTIQQNIDGDFYNVGGSYTSTAVGHPQPPNTTTLVPSSPDQGQTLQWTGSSWITSSFPYGLTLPQAQSNLIQQVTVNGAQAVNSEVSLYSTVQQIEAPSVSGLDALSYPGLTIGDYQTYIDGVVSDATATITSTGTVEGLYSFNPSTLPYAPAATGTIFTGRGSGVGPLDLNVSYFVTWNGNTPEADTELYIPGTSTTLAYGSGGAGQFDSVGNCFVTGDYLVQIRQASTGFVLAEFECPLSLAGENVDF
jgi:hypothetical protein